MLSLSSSLAATGDKLIITGDIVNLRTGPSTNAAAAIKLLKNHKVTEIQRQNNWIEIETHRKDIKTGWVHQSLLAKARASSRNTSSPTRFERFMQFFNDHNDIIKKKNGIIYFSKAKNKGNGEIIIIVTEAWLKADRKGRGLAMNTLFQLWSNVVPVGKTMSVRAYDIQGTQHMVMVR